MRQVLKPKDRFHDKIKGENISYLSFVVTCTSPTQINGNNGFDWDKIQIVLKAYQGGKETDVYSGSLRTIGTFLQEKQKSGNNILTNCTNYLTTGGMLASDQLSYFTQDTTKAVYFVRIPLFLNLKGLDYLDVNVNVHSNVFTGDVESTSSIVLQSEEGVFNQSSTPYYEVINLDGVQATKDLSFGDNVKSIGYCSNNFTSTQSGSHYEHPISSLEVKTDRYNFEGDTVDLRIKQSEGMNYGEVKILQEMELLTKYPSVMLLNGSEFDRVELKMNFNSAHYNENENWLVVERFLINPEVYRRASKRQDKHLKKAYRKLNR